VTEVIFNVKSDVATDLQLRKDELRRKRIGHSIRQVERLPSTTSEVILASTGMRLFRALILLFSLLFYILRTSQGLQCRIPI
jgi:hypothetical protein